MWSKEADYQRHLKSKILKLFPGAIVIKGPSETIQGIPDLIVLYKNKWCALEVKVREIATHQPNQDFYVRRMHKMSFARFIYPENEKEVFNEMAETFRTARYSRISQCE